MSETGAASGLHEGEFVGGWRPPHWDVEGGERA